MNPLQYIVTFARAAGGAIIDGLIARPNFNDMANLSLTSPSNGSATFNGTSDYVQILADGKGSGFETQKYTIGAWVNVKSFSTDFPIISYDFTSHVPPYYAMHLRLSGGMLQFFWNDGSQYRELLGTGTTLTTNRWYYVCGVYESGSQKIYVDGSVIASSSLSDTITFYNQEVWIGKSNYAQANGNLANVAVWNRALTSDEINSIQWKRYDLLTSGESTGLVAWYALDDITGTSVPDSTGTYNATAY